MRNSNFEVLRIIAIIMITAYHYSVHGVVDVDNVSGGGKFLLNLVSLWGKAGVNIFSLITGYFMIENENICYSKLIKLESQVLFYSMSGLLVGISLGIEMPWLSMFFPIITNQYWYITAFFLVYLLSPYINKMIRSLNINEFNNLVILLFVLWSIIPFFTFQRSKGFFWNQFIWFVVMYISGAYLKLNKPRYSKKIYKMIFFISNIILVGSCLLVNFASIYYEMPRQMATYCAWSNTPIVTAMCISLIRIAELKVPYFNKTINIFASLVIGIYLFQENYVFSRLCWYEWFNNSLPITIIQKTVHFLYSILMVCLIGGIIEYIRIRVFFKLLKL